MKEKTITLVPYGGIGNRMGSIASAFRLSRQLGYGMRVVWFRDWGMQAGFEDLFQPITGVDVYEPRWYDYVITDWPRKRNLYCPAPFQGMMYDLCFYGDSRYIGLKDIKSASKIYIASCYEFSDDNPSYDIFKPSSLVQERIQNLSITGDNLIGVHIRRGDHILARQQSPTSIFIDAMKDECIINTNTKFYLASDSQEEKEKVMKSFPEGMVICDSNTYSRGSLAAEIEAMAEIFVLSRCNKIFGSYNSTFGLRASQIGHIPYKIISKNE